jgi:hypothetical protein
VESLPVEACVVALYVLLYRCVLELDALLFELARVRFLHEQMPLFNLQSPAFGSFCSLFSLS